VKGENMKIKNVVFIAAVLFLTGCASNPTINSLTLEQRTRLNKIQAVFGGIDKPYKTIGKAKGLSCHRNAYAPRSITEDEAMQGVKINAVLMGADAVINIACQNNGVDWGNNCWSSIVCFGDAIKLN
jgi:rRNA processing protein Gar1